MSRRLLLLPLLLLLVLPASASALRLRGALTPAPVAGNPADALAALPADPERYDPATRCDPRPKDGVTQLLRWLDRHAAGESWGTYRCERWGRGQASLHAEGRAIDWHLDSRDPAQRAQGIALVRLLLAPDRAGTPHALARRMGVEELIWDCSYWHAGGADFGPYAPCFDRRGRPVKRVDPTAGHLDHVHIGLTRAGAAARSSFWTRQAP